jgi:hypothetical protein
MKHLHRRLDKMEASADALGADAPDALSDEIDLTSGTPATVQHYAHHGDEKRPITRAAYERYAAAGVPTPTGITVNLLPAIDA